MLRLRVRIPTLRPFTFPTNVNTDADAYTDYQEYVADTDGADSNDYFRITAVTTASSVTVYFDSSSNRWYTMEGRANLIEGTWTNIPGAGPQTGGGGSDSMQDTNVPSRGPFYRMQVKLPYN